MINESRKKSEKIYLSNILPIEKNIQPYGNYADSELILKLNNIINDVAKKNGVSVIDSNNEFHLKDNFTVDGVHLNQNGYSMLMSIWYRNVVECQK